MRTYRTLALVLAVPFAVGASARTANADDACHHSIPNGAHVYFTADNNAEVYDSTGAFVDAFSTPTEGCPAVTASGSPSGASPLTCGGFGTSCTTNSDCCTGDQCGWSSGKCDGSFYATWEQGLASTSYAPNLLSPAEYSELDVYWTVPNAPTSTDIDNEVYWNGVSMPSSGYLQQPELWYHGATNTWESQVQIVQGSNVILNVTPTCPALPGDSIEGFLGLETGGHAGAGETWNIYAINGRTGCSDQATFTYTGNGWGPFSKADYGVLEVQGLHACHGVPASGFVEFDLNALTEIGTGTTEYVDVRQGQVWNEHADTTASPLCNWHTYLSNDTNQDVMQVQWNSW